MRNNRKVEKGQVWAMVGGMDDLYVILEVEGERVEVYDLGEDTKYTWLIEMIEEDVFVM